jgi:hypothetical protein
MEAPADMIEAPVMCGQYANILDAAPSVGDSAFPFL